MIIYGESSGGASSILHVQSCIYSQLPIPQLCVSVSTGWDCMEQGESYITNETSELMMTLDLDRWYWKQVLGTMSTDEYIHSLQNPLRDGISFQQFCPTYISVSGAEMLLEV